MLFLNPVFLKKGTVEKTNIEKDCAQRTVSCFTRCNDEKFSDIEMRRLI